MTRARISLLGISLFGSALAVAACSPSARPTSSTPPLLVPRLVQSTVQAGPPAVRFPEGAAPPSGCFAISRRTGAVACLLGQYGLHTEAGERRLSLLQNSDEGVPDVPVRVKATVGGLELESHSRQMLDAIMREGDFVALGAPVSVPLDSPRSFGGMTIELRRASTSLSEELPPDARIYDLEVVVHADTNELDATDEVLLENTLTSVACLSPSLFVRVLEPRQVLIERECRLDESGEPELLVGAWLCDSDRARCD